MQSVGEENFTVVGRVDNGLGLPSQARRGSMGVLR
jgi:hypothetical protein